MGLNEACLMAQSRWEWWEGTDCESATRQDFYEHGTDWGFWGIRGALIGVGSPVLSGVSYGKARPGVHDLDSGDVDGESGT